MQDGKVDRSGAHSGQKHGQQVAVNAERWPCAPAVQQRKLAQLRRDGGCHVPPLQAERIEQAAGRHLVIGRHGCRAEQRGVAAGERLTEKQLAQLRCQRHENGSCRYADETHRRNGTAGQNTHACLLTDCLSRMGGRILPYIPDRLEEGYGLNAEAVSALAAQGVTLIVTVDCGITAGAETAFAASLGVDVVVTGSPMEMNYMHNKK